MMQLKGGGGGEERGRTEAESIIVLQKTGELAKNKVTNTALML